MIIEGLLLVDKPKGITSFTLVRQLRRLLGVKKIGHAGTLDPFATGLMVMLIGRNYTKQSDSYLHEDKEYSGRIKLGEATNTYDGTGHVTEMSDHQPSLEEVEEVLLRFQGTIQQTPPMFSAKKVKGKKLYELARKGQTVARDPVSVTVHLELVHYDYPFLDVKVTCSKGTYVRSLAHDIGGELGCFAHLSELTRLRCGPFTLDQSVDGLMLQESTFDPRPFLLT